MQKEGEDEPVKLDRLDYRILHELDCDAFQSLSKIGKKLHTGRDVMHYRVKRLEELGIIKNYAPIIDYGKMGYTVGAVYIKCHHDTPELRAEIIEYYKNNKDVWWIFNMTPDYDIALGWFGKSLAELTDKRIALLRKYKKYFREFKFRIYNRHHHFKRDYLTHVEPGVSSARIARTERSFVVSAGTEKLTDETDDKILKLLSENARLPYTEIADRLDLSAAQVHYRIQNLKQKKIILGAKPMLDLQKFGYGLFKLDIYLDDYSIYEDLRKFVHSLPNVVYSYDVIGGADIELDFEVRNFAELSKIQDAIKSKFGQAISHTEYYQFTKEYKLSYFLQV